jgi:hypothetical protein
MKHRRYALKTFIEDVQALLSITPERWQRLVSVVSADVLARPPLEGEWSALACLRHLLDAEHHIFPVRIRAFLAGQNFEDFDPNQQRADLATRAASQLVETFTRTRQENLLLFKGIKDNDLERTLQHPRLGTVTLSQLLHNWAAHDLMHTVQAERALMQPFIRASGPWHVFYKDHEVEEPGR